jgi:hypothetical protein
MSAPVAVVAGGLAQRSTYGGHVWMFLQYVLGLRRLGFDVLFVDRFEPEWERDASTDGNQGAGAAHLAALGRALAIEPPAVPHAVVADHGRSVLGMDRDEVLARVRHSSVFLNVMGFVDDAEVLDAAPLRVFLDIDPGFPQMWHAAGLADVMAGHDRFVTVGANVGGIGCGVPTAGVEWITTRPPVVLDHWPVAPGPGRAITTVASWRGPFAPVELDGETYGLRVHEFRRYVDLPARAARGQELELALDIDTGDGCDRRRLEACGWRIVDPRQVACDPSRYRDYIASSSAELNVAKNMYVATRSGWFSDRSACYLASGRPVLAQDTGLAGHYPVDAGLLVFSDPDELVARLEELDRDYTRHACAARAIAVEHLAADRVLRRLLASLGVQVPAG